MPQEDSTLVTSKFAAALRHHQLGQLSEAEQLYHQVLKIDPQHADSLHLLGTIAMQAEQYDAAIAFISCAIGIRGHVAAYYVNLGTAAQGAGHLNDAVAAYQKAIALEPGFAEAHSNLGNALQKSGLLTEAIAAYRHAIGLRPDLVDAHTNLAVALQTTGDLAHAAEAFSAAARLAPDNLQAAVRAAEAALAAGRTDEAIAGYRRAHAMAPNDSAVAVSLSGALLATGAAGESESLLREVIAREPKSLPAHRELVESLRQQARFNEALAVADTMVALEPAALDGHHARGVVLLEIGEAILARDAFAQAVAAQPLAVESIFGLAVAESRCDNTAGAVLHAKRVLELAPNHAMARHLAAAWAAQSTEAAPAEYVRNVFNAAAERFDEELQTQLQYNTPEDAATLLHDFAPRPDRFRRLLDLGCGTGLVAAAIGKHFDIPERVGVDLAPKMLSVAKAKGIYTHLVEADAVDALRDSTGAFDLVAAIEMFIYLGRLDPFMAALANRLAPKGIFIYSIETGDDALKLMPSGRFAHNLAALERLASAHGLKPAAGHPIVIRWEYGQPVHGYLGMLTRD